MLIDWFTVAAQILNFLILVFLLKRFLYDRIIGAMDAREEKIQTRLREADEKNKNAEKQATAYRHKQQELQDEAAKMMAEAKEDADDSRKKLIEKARQEADRLEKQWKEALKQHKESFLRDLAHLTQEHVYGISRRVLRDLSGVEVEERAIAAFLKQMGEAEEETKKAFASAVEKSDGELTVSSGFKVPEDRRDTIAMALREKVGDWLSAGSGDGIKVHFQVNQDIGFGIELATKGRKVAWSLNQYIKGLEEKTRELVDEEEHEIS